MKHVLRTTFHAFAPSLTALAASAAAGGGFIGFSGFGGSQTWEREL